jgi:hypothetical protein
VSEQELNPELTALTEALARLQPRPAALDRDLLMFRAGQASAPRNWKWPVATTAATLLALGFGVALLFRSPPAAVVQTIYVQVSTPDSDKPVLEPKPLPPPPDTSPLLAHQSETAPLSDYHRLENHLLRWGFDGLPQAPPVTPQEEARDNPFDSF